jgi:hypothetical protein
MTEQHPIAPPPELVQQWAQMTAKNDIVLGNWVYIATQAARWGADQELEACRCFLLTRTESDYGFLADELRAARRPKPPSLKEQALAELEKVDMLWDTSEFGAETLSALDTIRLALEQLPDTL